MKQQTLRVLAVLAVVAMSIFAVACGSSDSTTSSSSDSAAIPTTPEAGQFRMGIEPWLGYGPWYVAQEQGIFKANGLDDVKIINFTTDDQINSAFAAGKLDGSNIATHTALRFAAAGLPVKIILLEDQSMTADAILAGSEIKTIKDLMGKKVAYEEGTTSDILLSYALAQNGMTKDDIISVPTPAADAGTLFLAGKVPAAVTYEPYLSAALKENKDAKLLYTAAEKPGLVSDVFVVSEDTINNKPGQLLALVNSWGQAIDYYNANKTASQKIIADAIGYDPGAESFAGVEFYTIAQNKTLLDGDFKTITAQEVKKAATDAGLIKGSVNPADIIVAKFVDAAK